MAWDGRWNTCFEHHCLGTNVVCWPSYHKWNFGIHGSRRAPPSYHYAEWICSLWFHREQNAQKHHKDCKEENNLGFWVVVTSMYVARAVRWNFCIQSPSALFGPANQPVTAWPFKWEPSRMSDLPTHFSHAFFRNESYNTFMTTELQNTGHQQKQRTMPLR